MFNKEDLIKATGAKILKDNGRDINFNISTDTRTISDKDIYLPLKGETFDGEKFIDKAIANGAKAYFTTGETIFDKADLVLKVSDTKDSYMKIAQFYLNKINPIKIGITGSAGKTTTKEMVYSVLNYKFRTHKTFSNHNNEIGFCQTALSMAKDSQILIVEMGMRGLGEIEYITKYFNPDYAIVTNSGSAHVGRLGSLDNIAIAKCEIAKGLKQNGAFISLNQDIIKKHLKYSGEKIFYSLDDVEILERKPSYTKFLYMGNLYELNVDGDYNIENSLSAINVGLRTGLTPEEIAKGLKTYHPIEKRWEIEKINGVEFINDSYNANPESMKASVKAFIELYPNPVVILGDMAELGDDEIRYHREVGKYLSSFSKYVKYILVGKLARYIGKALETESFEVKYFDTNEQVALYIIENLNKSNTIFLKASRAMKFEEILEKIKK